MALTKVLITVKTYPTLSERYDELVCTAGFLEDGSWVRIYPVPFRKLDYESRYKKYDWIELDLVRNDSDFRKESHKVVSIEREIRVMEHLGTEQYWQRRREAVLRNVCQNMSELIEKAKDPAQYTSLAVLKPKKMLSFETEEAPREWDAGKVAKLKAKALQYNIFQNAENPFEVVDKLPYKFSYKFISEDDVERTLMIEDWEIGALYWNCLRRHEGNEAKACEDVKKKYWDDFALKKDLYLFLGTTRQYHLRAPNPFIIIGTFHPPKVVQTSMF
jgi:hypothetical protein